MNRTPISRRRLMQGAGGLVAASTLSTPWIARAQSRGRIVVGTWGGDYARLLDKNIDEPILRPAGWEVVQDQAGDPERRAKMAAERRLPRGTSDVQGLSALNMFAVFEQGLTQEIDYSRLKNGGNLIDSMKYPSGVGHIYSGKIIVYNPKNMDAPASYAEALNTKHGSKLGIIDIQYQYNLMAASLAAGGGVADMDGAKKLLRELRAAGARIYPSNEAFAQGLAAGEIDVGIMWKARQVQWEDAGISVAAATPAEGTLAYVSVFVVPRNAPNLDGAYAYLDAMLEPSAQENFAVDMGYMPTVTNAVVSPELNARIGFTPEEVAGLLNPDFAFMMENDVALKDWWDRDFKA